MNLAFSSDALATLQADLLVIPIGLVDLEGVPEQAALDAVAASEPVLTYSPDHAAGRVAYVPLGAKPSDLRERRRNLAGKAARLAQRLKVATVALALPPDDDADLVTDLVEGFLLGGYQFLRYKTGAAATPSTVETLVLATTATGLEDAARSAQIRAEATCWARDLVNLSPDELTAVELGRLAQVHGEAAGLAVNVRDKTWLEAEGMGGVLGVNRGSMDPPVFIEVTYRPEDAINERPVVLVGKAIVFDTGGLSLKPTADSMDRMKADMAGGAAVLGALVAAARLKLPLHLVGLIPSTDNRPGERAYVPGDVLRMHSGLTVEVLNTDAEGRLILADALSYAARFQPEQVVDVATLTGAQVVALGSKVAAILTSETDGAAERLAALDAAGRATGDLVAALPMYEHYGDQLKSEVADLKNIGGREAGTITAAKFLERFTSYPWTHIDMAGCGFISETLPYRAKGGTGYGVRLLVEWLQRRAAQG